MLGGSIAARPHSPSTVFSMRKIVFQFFRRANSYIIHYGFIYAKREASARRKLFVEKKLFRIIYIAGRELNNKQKSAEAQCGGEQEDFVLEVKSVVFSGKAIKMLKILRVRR